MTTPIHRNISLKPINIDNIVIDTPLTLAPMAGHTNHALRTLCREQGDCGLVCTELFSSTAMSEPGTLPRTMQMIDWTPGEEPFAVQLFGHDPQLVADAARFVVDHGAQIVDINMGCWVPKVAKRGAGAALLRDINKATAVVEAVVKAVEVPVTVKVRSGYEDGVVTAVPFAKAAEEAGAKAIAVHARFARQGFTGEADWDVIRQVKEVVTHIPVLGNGDVVTPQDAYRMIELTGCDGVMIGRGALGHPWLFRHIKHYLDTGELLPEPTRAERAALALRHMHLTLESTKMVLIQAVLEMRGQLSKYNLDLPGSVEVRNRIVRASTPEELEAILLPIAESAD